MYDSNKLLYIIGDWDDWSEEELALSAGDDTIVVDGLPVAMLKVTIGTSPSFQPAHKFEFYFSKLILLNLMFGDDGHRDELLEEAETLGQEVLVLDRNTVAPFVQALFDLPQSTDVLDEDMARRAKATLLDTSKDILGKDFPDLFKPGSNEKLLFMARFLDWAQIPLKDAQKKPFCDLFRKPAPVKYHWVWTEVDEVSSFNERTLKITGKCAKLE